MKLDISRQDIGDYFEKMESCTVKCMEKATLPAFVVSISMYELTV
jgi:hypothetical protein